MKIAVDISQIVYKGTGVARYTASLVDVLLDDTHHDYIFFFSGLRAQLDEDIKKRILQKATLKELPFPPSALNLMWNTFHKIPMEKFVGKVDIVFASDWTSPPTKKAKKITTIHDMVIYTFPETSTQNTTLDVKSMNLKSNIVDIQKKRLEWAKKEYDILLCDSESTKDDVKKYLHIDEKKLKVLYPFVEIDTRIKETKKGEKYILTVGTLQPRKNLLKLFEAFNKLNVPNIKLYVVGMQGWGEKVTNANPHIKLLGFVPDEKLYELYANATMFVAPALYEGFGYPTVEAMNFGCPVITSNTSSLNEISEGYGLTFDPTSVEDITAKLKQVYDDKQLQDELRKKSLKRAKDFTKQKFTKELLTVFEELK